LTDKPKKFGYLKETAIGAVSGAAALALIIGGFSISSGSNNSASQPTDSSSASASSTPLATPTSSRTCSVADYLTDPLLGNLSAVVIDAATDEVLFDRNANTPAATASVMKLLTAAAALESLGPNYRAETRVYQDSTSPGVLYLVGGGDPTLSRTAVGAQSVYRDAPKLSTLALNVNQRLNGTAVTRIVLDSSMFPAPSWESSWERSEQTQGYMSEVTALQVDGDRANPSQETSKRSTNPVGAAGQHFKKALGAAATSATIAKGSLSPSAVEIAKVVSQPISKWITHMLQVSDNTEAEALARLISLDQGFDGSFSSLTQAYQRALAGTGLDLSGIVIRDGSGLSDFNAVSPATVAKLMKLVINQTGNLAVINQGLPVAGESGSLANRFKGDNIDAAGHIFAKTGWIKKGYTLAGYMKPKDGSVLTFAIYALGSVSDSTKGAIDNLATAIYRCGANLAPQ
jgi:D-alanyl-D-alanine carboxypeptidase/D-alanyl-D-alanine-endopeptidase (penicillin-binding protein 4)